MAARRIREARRFQSDSMYVYNYWQRPGIEEADLNWYIELFAKRHSHDEPRLRSAVESMVYDTVSKRYILLLETTDTTIDVLASTLWEDAKFEAVGERLWSYLDTLEQKYPHAVKQETALQRLIKDDQNVHTREVTKQTDKSMQILDSMLIPSKQRTMDEIIEVWLNDLHLPWITISPVYEDMKAFGNKTTIYSPNDYLYRKTLRSLWALIKTYKSKETQNELARRLWEETKDSLEMCAQGHITRLANVMVGFHDDFLTPQDPKEKFQDQMAEIARSEKPTEAKVAEATILMDALDMPQDERTPWLEAF
jgi:hypothetical protein